MGERNPRAGQLGGDAQRLRAEPRPHDPGMERLTPEHPQTCIYPGCARPVVPPHTLGGPPSAFCELEEHNALTAHQRRQQLEREGENSDDEEVDRAR